MVPAGGGQGDKPQCRDGRIETVQLVRLAGAVLEKSPEDLMAIASCNPSLIWEWLEAFRDRRLEAEQEARFWAAVIASLSTAIPPDMRSAAE
jgi:hypothetical protein